MAWLLTGLVLFVAVARPAVAGEPVAFNFPEPPREGRPDYFTLADGGQARAVIVHPRGASKRLAGAASSLAAYLQLVTGAKFPVMADGEALPAGMGAIHVGDTHRGLATPLDLPDVRYGDEVLPNLSGYLIRTPDPHTLVIRGRTEMATNHALVGFLRRYVGVRQYWMDRPGGLGDVIPSRPTLRVPELEWRDWPYFVSRSLSMHAFAGHALPALDFYRRHATLPCSENYNAWLPPERFGDVHPEYFPLISGKRRVPLDGKRAMGWQPCASNPEVARIMGAAVVEYFRKNPEAAGVNFAVNDGGGDCTCPACRALDAPGADYSQRLGMSDRYVKLSNQVCQAVRQEFPSKLLVYLAYGAARSVPSTASPDPMLLPVLTTPDNAFAAWDAWMKTGVRHMGLYVHHNDSFFILPKFDVFQAAKRIRYAVASGRARVFYMETHTIWPFNDVVPYVVADLLWDPRQDVDRILDEYYTSFYGPAAAPMREFHRALDAGYRRWLEAEGTPHPFGKDVSSIRHGRTLDQFRVLNPAEAARAGAALAEAAALAKSDEEAAQRVELLSLMFRLQEMAVRQYWTAVRLRQEPVRSEADARQRMDDARTALALAGQMGDYIGNVLEKPPASAYRLFKQSEKGLEVYDQLKSGQPAPEILAAVAAGVDAAAAFLRQSLEPDRAAAWWHAQRQAERNTFLAGAFQAAELRASGLEITNLLEDPGFEEIGRQLAPDEFAVEKDIAVTPELEQRLGIHQWFPERSPYRCVLTAHKPHSGRYALWLEHCHRARFSRHARAAPGERFRISLWLKHSGPAASYSVTVTTRSEEGVTTALASIRVPDKPDQWQEIVTEVVAPPKARLVGVQLFIDRQAAGARCSIDDVFIGQYPK